MIESLLPTEDQEQIALVHWAAYHTICKDHLLHIPNGGSRHKLEAYKLKKMGVRKGVSDFFLAYPIDEYHGLWIELKSKRKTARVSREQCIWLGRMECRGYAAETAYGCDGAIKIILRYLKEDK